MTKPNWQRGYKEVKNAIHNEVGITKEELTDIFREIAREEVKKIVLDNEAFIKDTMHTTMKEIIRSEMLSAISKENYLHVAKDKGIFGQSYTNSFQSYVSGVMKDEILKRMDEQFSVGLTIQQKTED